MSTDMEQCTYCKGLILDDELGKCRVEEGDHCEDCHDENCCPAWVSNDGRTVS